MVLFSRNILSVAEAHHFDVAPAPGKNFDAAPAAPAPTLLSSKPTFFKNTKVNIGITVELFSMIFND
jgi:hypothetical protein